VSDAGCSAEQSAATEPCRERSPAPARTPLEADVEALLHSPSGESTKGHEHPLSRGPSGPSGAAATKPRRMDPLSADRFGVHFTADGEFCALLERVRGLAGHRLPSGDLMTLLKRGLEAYERELEKERFAVGRKARRSRQVESLPETPNPNPSPAPKPIRNPTRRRRCPAEVARAVFVRDGKQCTYVSPDGRRCGARRCLELDHIDPFVEGGEETIQNLRLRCRAHNQWYARQYFGSMHLRAAMQQARRRRAARRRHAARQTTNQMPTPRETGNESSCPPEKWRPPE
jgi:hypothetical protein